MKRIVVLAGLAALLIFSYQNFTKANSVALAQPNILVIMLDDAGQGELLDPKLMPHLNSFRKNAILFPHFYTAPMCAPTRISMLSGRSYVDYSILWVCGSDAVYGIPKTDVSLPLSLKQRGYATASMGKWHAGTSSPLLRGSEAYDIDKKFDVYFKSNGVMVKGYHNNGVAESSAGPVTVKGHLTDFTASRVIEYFKKANSAATKKPFYLQYWLNAPHAPHEPHESFIDDPKFLAEYKKANSASQDPAHKKWARQWKQANKPRLYKYLMKQADHNIGRVIKEIEGGSEFLKNTVILVTSDNGGTRETRSVSSAYGNMDHLGRDLRGFKTDLFEGGIRQPLIVRVPGQQGARIDNSVVTVTDFFPTFIELAKSKVTAKEALQLDGQSFYKNLFSANAQLVRSSPLFWTFKAENEHVSVTEGYDQVNYAIRDGDWKLVSAPLEGCKPCLFKFSGGHSSERTSDNLAASMPKKVKELREKYLEWYLMKTQLKVSPETQSPKDVRIIKGSLEGFKKTGPREEIISFDLGNQGWVKLKNNIKFDVNRLDFTLSARIRPKAIAGVQVIAMREGSWIFQLNERGQLEVITRDPKGVSTIITAPDRLKAGHLYDVAFDLYAFKSLSTVVKIHARDHNNDLDTYAHLRTLIRRNTTHNRGLATNNNTIYIGAPPSTSMRSFEGRIDELRLHHAPLRRSEIGYSMRWWGDLFD